MCAKDKMMKMIVKIKILMTNRLNGLCLMRVVINVMMTKGLKEALLPSSSLLDLTGGAATIKGQPSKIKLSSSPSLSPLS